jgi:hypothetical protein
MRLVLLLVMCLVAPLLRAADLIDSLQFADGQDRSQATFSHQSTVLIYFSGECPTAAAWMGSQVKNLHDWLEQEHVNASLVLITPDVAPGDLLALDDSRNYHMVNAFYATDPANREHISLQNIMQVRLMSPSGAVQMLPFDNLVSVIKSHLPDSSSAAAGSYRISRDGLSEPAVIELWWAVERARPDAVKTLMSSARSAKLPAEVRVLADRVTAFYAAREQELSAAPATLETVESLEVLLTESKGLPMALAHKRYHDLQHAKELHNELRARDEFSQCKTLLRSNRPADQSDGRDGLAAISHQFPTTVYGAKATALLQSLPVLKGHDSSN